MECTWKSSISSSGSFFRPLGKISLRPFQRRRIFIAGGKRISWIGCQTTISILSFPTPERWLASRTTATTCRCIFTTAFPCACPTFCLMANRRNGRAYRRRAPAASVSSASWRRLQCSKRLKGSIRRGSLWRVSSVPILMSVCLSATTRRSSRISRRGFLIFCTTTCRCSHRHRTPKRRNLFGVCFFYKTMILS
mgnify:CR=1 FL=1